MNRCNKRLYDAHATFHGRRCLKRPLPGKEFCRIHDEAEAKKRREAARATADQRFEAMQRGWEIDKRRQAVVDAAKAALPTLPDGPLKHAIQNLVDLEGP